MATPILAGMIARLLRDAGAKVKTSESIGNWEGARPKSLKGLTVLMDAVW